MPSVWLPQQVPSGGGGDALFTAALVRQGCLSACVGGVRVCRCVNGVVRAGCVSGVAASMLPPRHLDVASIMPQPRSGSAKIRNFSTTALITSKLGCCNVCIVIISAYLLAVMQQALLLCISFQFLIPFLFLQVPALPPIQWCWYWLHFYNIALVGQHSKTFLWVLLFFPLKVVGSQQVLCAVVHVPPFVGHCRVYLLCAYIYICPFPLFCPLFLCSFCCAGFHLFILEQLFVKSVVRVSWSQSHSLFVFLHICKENFFVSCILHSSTQWLVSGRLFFKFPPFFFHNSDTMVVLVLVMTSVFSGEREVCEAWRRCSKARRRSSVFAATPLEHRCKQQPKTELAALYKNPSRGCGRWRSKAVHMGHHLSCEADDGERTPVWMCV